MKYRTKFFIATLAFIIFWFVIFYPYVSPYLQRINLYPTLGVVIFESFFFITMLLLSNAMLGEQNQKHSLRLAIALFVGYHIFDAIEPPFILTASGADLTNPTKLFSWDYGLAYPLHQIFGLPWTTLYYAVNLGFILIMLILLIYIVKPTILGKISKKLFK